MSFIIVGEDATRYCCYVAYCWVYVYEYVHVFGRRKKFTENSKKNSVTGTCRVGNVI